MSEKNTNKNTGKTKGRVVLIIAVLFIAVIIGNVVYYKAEQNKSASGLEVRQDKQTELKVVEMASQSDTSTKPQMPMGTSGTAATAGTNSTGAPKLSEGAMLPSNVPPAMLKALEERGMSIEELQKQAGQRNQGNQSGMSGMGMGAMGSSGVPEKMGDSMQNAMSSGQFPEAMQRAIAEREAQKNATPQQNMNKSNHIPAYVENAIRHIEGHNNDEETTLMAQSLNALAQNDKDVNALMTLTTLFANHNEIEAAQYLAQEASTIAPTDPDVAYVYGVILAKNFQTDDAATQWERALSLKDDAQLRVDLARLYRYQLANMDKAKEHFNQALNAPNITNDLKREIEQELKN